MNGSISTLMGGEGGKGFDMGESRYSFILSLHFSKLVIFHWSFPLELSLFRPASFLLVLLLTILSRSTAAFPLNWNDALFILIQLDSNAQPPGKRELAALTAPPKFDNVDDERRYLKETLVAAIRIFAKYDLDHTIAGSFLISLSWCVWK